MPVARARPRAPHKPKLVDLSALSPRALNDLTPSDAESRTIKQSLANALAQLHQLEANISNTQRKLASFSARRDHLLDQTHRYRVALAPHKRLPPEILIEIFVACLPDTIQLPPCVNSPPLSLTRISSSWRTLALGAQELWNQFQVSLSARPLRNHHAQTAFQIWLSRCPDRPLSFSITTTPRAPFPLPGIHHSILPIDFILPYTRRIQNLEMQNISGEQMDVLVSLPRGSFPILEEMDVFLRDSWVFRNVDAESAPLVVFCGARRLRKVTVRGFDGSFNPAMLALPWDQLTVLRIDTLPSEAGGCHEMLSVCERVEEVSVRIMRIEDGPRGMVRTTTRLGRLRWLSVRFESVDYFERFLNRFEVPMLESLKTKFDWNNGGGVGVHSTFASSNPYINLIEQSQCPIKTLHIGRNTPDFPIKHLLTVAPSLEELYLEDHLVVSAKVWENIGKGVLGGRLERVRVCVGDVDPVLGMLEDRMAVVMMMMRGEEEGVVVFREIRLGCPKMTFQQRWRMECLEKMGLRIVLCHYGFFG